MQKYLLALLPLLLISLCLNTTSQADIFFDDFNRADGPLVWPWEVLQSPLYIDDAHVTAPTGEFGLMGYSGLTWASNSPDASLAADFSYSADIDLCGRFQFFIYGTDEYGYSYWGFIAKISASYLSIFNLNPEQEIASNPLALTAVSVYSMRLEYTSANTTVSLEVRNSGGYLLGQLQEQVPCNPFYLCAIGIENLNCTESSKWLDNVAFEYDSVTPVVDGTPEMAVSLQAWPRPFTNNLQILAVAGRSGETVVSIHDLQGRQVRRLVLPGGAGRWDGRNSAGQRLPAGVYLIRSESDPEARPIKVLLLH